MEVSHKILVVDDQELNVELLIDILIDEGYQVATASNGVEAIEKFKQFKPDMILLDVMMPVMDGYQACQAIRDLEEEGSSVPILFISAKAALEDKIRGYEVGGDEYIVKPFDNSELLIKINLVFKETKKIKAMRESIKDSNEMAYSLMTTASKVGAIGQFLRKTLSCNTLDELFQSFFELSLGAELGCTIKTTLNDDTIIVSDDGVEHPIDFEIISQYSSKDRIFYFGKNRALFNWDNLIMLVRNVGDEADNIAIMLDGLSAGIKFIQMQSILLSSIQVFKMANAQLNLKAVAVTENIEEEIRKAFDEIGSGSNLTEAEEDSIHVIVDKNRNMLDEILLSIRELEIEMEQTLSQYIDRK